MHNTDMPTITIAHLPAAIDGASDPKQAFNIDIGDGFLIPIFIFNGKTGPAALFIGGVHGDEFEGPAALTHLVGTLDPGKLNGRLIIVPAVNPAALAARTRHSSVDGKDLNRSLPGNNKGSLSERIAAMLAEILMPRADVVYDFHSGGMDNIVNSVIIHPRPHDIAAMNASINAAIAFGPDAILFAVENGGETMTDGEAERQKKIFGCVESGGAGTLQHQMVTKNVEGAQRLLAHLGMIDSALMHIPSIRYLSALGVDHDQYVEHSGFFMPVVRCGDYVEANSIIAKLYDPVNTLHPAHNVHTLRSGIVYMISIGGPLHKGDVCAVIVDELANEVALRNIATK
jgi:N2-acetyl-L-2,4-diaminobutanoate deacetylase